MKRPLLSILLAFAGAGVSQAAGIISNTPDPFPNNNVFASPGGCFPFAGFCATNLQSSNYRYNSLPNPNPDFTGGNETAWLTATYTGTLTDLSMNPLPGGDFSVDGTLEFVISGRAAEFELGTWNAELVYEHIQATAAGHTIDLLVDHTNSTGTISINQVPDYAQDLAVYEIDSAFNVNATMKIDSFDAFPVAFPIDAAVPEPATWALIGLPLAALLRLRKRSM